MSEYRFRTSAADAPRVVMGYAGMTEARIREAIKRLGEALGARRRHRD